MKRISAVTGVLLALVLLPGVESHDVVVYGGTSCEAFVAGVFIADSCPAVGLGPDRCGSAIDESNWLGYVCYPAGHLTPPGNRSVVLLLEDIVSGVPVQGFVCQDADANLVCGDGNDFWRPFCAETVIEPSPAIDFSLPTYVFPEAATLIDCGWSSYTSQVLVTHSFI